MASTRAGKAGKLLPYVLGADEAYNIELTEGHLRFFQDGALLTSTETVVSNIALSGTVTQVTLPSGHGIVEGDNFLFIFNNEEGKTTYTELLNRQFFARNVTSTTVDIANAETGEILSDGFDSFATSDIILQKITDLSTPYSETQWPDVKIIQSDDRTLLLHGSVQPRAITTGSISKALFVDGPYLDPVPNSLLTPDTTNGSVTLTLSYAAYNANKSYSTGDYVLSSATSYKSLTDVNEGNTPASSASNWEVVLPIDHVNSGAGFGPGDTSRHIRLFSEPAAWLAGTAYVADDHVKHDDAYWICLAASTGDEPGADVTKWASDPGAAVWTWGKVASTSVDLSNSPSLIAQSDGTIIGNTHAESEAFNGVTGTRDDGAHSVGETTSDTYIGKNFSAPTAISSVRIFAAGDRGFVENDNHTVPITFRLYAKATLPSSATDGTLLGSHTIPQDKDYLVVTIASNDIVTTWDYAWVVISTSQNKHRYFGEVEFYDASAVPAGSRLIVQIIGDPLLYTTAISTWRLGLYNDVAPLWPTNGVYHQGRFWLGGAVPNRIDASKSNEELVFSPTGADGVVADNNSFSYTLNATERNQILWMSSSNRGVLTGTAGGEYLFHASDNNNLITPTSIQADLAARYGCADVKPAFTGLTTVFVHEHARQLHEGFQDAYSSSYVAPELTDRVKSFTRGGIAELAFTQALEPIVWMRTGTGGLIATTYNRNNLVGENPPAYNAFHHHELGSGRLVESISVAPSIGGGLDTLAMIVKGQDGVYYVDYMTAMPEEDDTVFGAQFLDSALIPAAAEVYTTGAGGVRFHGLHHLINATVSVWAAGLDLGGNFIVNEGGYVDCDWASDSNSLFTQRYLEQLTGERFDYGDRAVKIDGGELIIPAVVGFAFKSRGQLLRPVSQAATGIQIGTAFGMKRRAHGYSILAHNTQGLSVGTNFDTLRPSLFEFAGGRRYTPTELFSGIHSDTLADDSGTDGQIAWEIARPYPATIQAVGVFLKTEDK